MACMCHTLQPQALQIMLRPLQQRMRAQQPALEENQAAQLGTPTVLLVVI